MRFFKTLLEGLKSFVLGMDPVVPEEGRISPRILCQYRVVVQHLDQRTPCSVVDIGVSGMCLEGVPSLQKGQRIELFYPLAEVAHDKRALEVEVMWCRESLLGGGLAAGVSFLKTGTDLEGSWVDILLREVGLVGDGAYHKRKHPRHKTVQKVFLRDSDTGHHILEGRVNNISLGGALVESRTKLKPGRQVLALIGPQANAPTVAVKAKVVASRKDSEDDHFWLSLQFVELTKNEFKMLESLVMAALKARTT